MNFQSIKKSLFLFSFLCLVFLFFYGINKLTDGFSLRQIQSSLSNVSSVEDPSLSTELKKEIALIFDQTFHYLGKGCQFYAFQSDDSRYVLKFFKHKHLRPMTWLMSFPLPKYLKSLSQKKCEKRERRVLQLFESCQLAYEELPEETGVKYIHLKRQPAVYKTVVLYDKLGLSHRVYLDDYEFVLQKKAIPVKVYFSSLINEGKTNELKEKVSNLLELVEKRCAKGIKDRDRSFVQNVAFSQEGHEAVFVDIGQFYKDESAKLVEETRKDVNKRLFCLKFWAQEKYPEVLSYIVD